MDIILVILILLTVFINFADWCKSLDERKKWND